VAAGQKVEKIPLPATKEGWLETITFTVAKPLYGTGHWPEHPNRGPQCGPDLSRGGETVRLL